MFAVRSPNPVSVSDAFDGLRRLAVEHKDGWGICRFDSGAPEVEMGLKAAHVSPAFERHGTVAAANLLAHIRLASVGDVHERNLHPFLGRGWVFMHNGTLRRFAHAREKFDQRISPELARTLRGETDSERCFALFLTLLGEHRDLPSVAKALAGVMRFSEEVCDDGRAPHEKRSAMNFMVSDGRVLVATRRDRTLFHASRGTTHFIASEQLGLAEDWHEVAQDGVVTIDEQFRLSVSTLSDWS
jgi:glutamine amidotransferase